MNKNYIEKIYEKVACKALVSLESEKATKISRKTLKLIALTEKLHRVLYRPI